VPLLRNRISKPILPGIITRGCAEVIARAPQVEVLELEAASRLLVLASASSSLLASQGSNFLADAVPGIVAIA